VQALHLGSQHANEVGVVTALVVDALERTQSRNVVGIDVEGALVVPDSLFGLPHVLVEELAEVDQDHLAVVVCDRNVEGALQRFADALPLRAEAMDRGHLTQDLNVVRVQRHDLLVVGLRVLRAAEVLAVPLTEPQTELDLLSSVRLFLEPPVRGVEKLVPAVGRVRHPFEIARRFVVSEVLGERVHERVERLVLVLESLLEDLGDATQKIALFLSSFAAIQTP
jgi:hypothetical protein